MTHEDRPAATSTGSQEKRIAVVSRRRSRPPVPRRIRKGITPRLRFAILHRDNFTCRYCGRRAPDVILHVDHVTALAAGGKDEWNNFVTACESCNLGKSDTTLSATFHMDFAVEQQSKAAKLAPRRAKSDPLPITDYLRTGDALSTMLQCKLRLLAQKGHITLSIAETINRILDEGDSVDLTAADGRVALANLGIRVDSDCILIANKSRVLSRLITGRESNVEWTEALRILNGATASRKPVYFAPGLFSRATILKIEDVKSCSERLEQENGS